MLPALGVVEDAVGSFGPFLIPVVLFVAGVTLYAVLYYLGRTDVGVAVDDHTGETHGPEDPEDPPDDAE